MVAYQFDDEFNSCAINQKLKQQCNQKEKSRHINGYSLKLNGACRSCKPIFNLPSKVQFVNA